MKIIKFAFYLLWQIVRTLFVWLILPALAIPFLLAGLVVIGAVLWVGAVWKQFNAACAK